MNAFNRHHNNNAIAELTKLDLYNYIVFDGGSAMHLELGHYKTEQNSGGVQKTLHEGERNSAWETRIGQLLNRDIEERFAPGRNNPPHIHQLLTWYDWDKLSRIIKASVEMIPRDRLLIPYDANGNPRPNSDFKAIILDYTFGPMFLKRNIDKNTFRKAFVTTYHYLAKHLDTDSATYTNGVLSPIADQMCHKFDTAQNVYNVQMESYKMALRKASDDVDVLTAETTANDTLRQDLTLIAKTLQWENKTFGLDTVRANIVEFIEKPSDMDEYVETGERLATDVEAVLDRILFGINGKRLYLVDGDLFSCLASFQLMRANLGVGGSDKFVGADEQYKMLLDSKRDVTRVSKQLRAAYLDHAYRGSKVKEFSETVRNFNDRVYSFLYTRFPTVMYQQPVKRGISLDEIPVPGDLRQKGDTPPMVCHLVKPFVRNSNWYVAVPTSEVHATMVFSNKNSSQRGVVKWQTTAVAPGGETA